MDYSLFAGLAAVAPKGPVASSDNTNATFGLLGGIKLPEAPAVSPPMQQEPDMPYNITPQLRSDISAVAERLGAKPEHLLAAINFETGGSFSPSQKNTAGSGAVGMIQFMPATLAAMGTTPEKAAKMTHQEQLGLVEKYFAPYKGRLNSLSDVYAAILWPKAVGKPDDYVLFDRDEPNHLRYAQNAGLDFNHDGKVTKGEATLRVRQNALKVNEPVDTAQK